MQQEFEFFVAGGGGGPGAPQLDRDRRDQVVAVMAEVLSAVSCGDGEAGAGPSALKEASDER